MIHEKIISKLWSFLVEKLWSFCKQFFKSIDINVNKEYTNMCCMCKTYNEYNDLSAR